MTMKRSSFLIGLGLAGLLAAMAPARSRAVQGPANQAPTAEARTRTQATADERAADREAIQGLVASFVKAFDAGDARAIGAMFTPGARLTTMDGQVVEGRESIERRFAASFEESPGQKIEIKTESLRFLDADAAIEEGTAAVSSPDGSGEPAAGTTRYTVAYVKRDGRWLQDSLHDQPIPRVAAEPTAADRLKELEWLVGEWIDESDDAEVRTTCTWAENRSFLIRAFRVKVAGKEVMTGTQRIGWDPRDKQFRSWVFDSAGGFSEGRWSREGDRWLIKSTGTLKDGRTASATNIVTRVGKNTMKWTSTDRTLGEEIMPDEEEVTLVRIPPLPRGARPVATEGK
ncbi:SnoaL-like domain protein [Aquisphaera giovannonii]|uniref:SnoaL-like domain protein n=1 Tax=Aquisphaera giovannonii TaxID=406548 RepID=A0A5B9WF61_9BACT|nr:SgcJ/EcaC family oxidoreductase [Aquisphaera giovannonii]QEH38520.1 SnoaL-like domain protein [Aquisphaera giovannonii]